MAAKLGFYLNITITILSFSMAHAQLTPEMQRKDLDQLNSALISMHPGIHRYTSVDDLADARMKLESSLDRPRSPLEFYRLVAPYVSMLRCDHTSLQPPKSVTREMKDGRNLFPLRIRRLGERWWVVQDFHKQTTIEPGTELLSINGRPMCEIEQSILPALSTDGFIETGALYNLQKSFPVLYALHIEFAPNSFALILADDKGKQFGREVTGLSREEIGDRDSKKRSPYNCSYLDEGKHALIDIRNFETKGFRSFVKSTFAGIQQRKIDTVTLDLRGNGGGTDEWGALLCSYFLKHPFGYYNRIEVTDDYRSKKQGVKTIDGLRQVTKPEGLSLQAPATNVFTGRVFVLIDGGTFSTAADVASVLHSNGVGTFIGEESGGGYYGNTSGDSSKLKLAESGIKLELQKWMYTTAIGDRGAEVEPGRGVPVEHKVAPTISELLNGEDVGLRKVRDLLSVSEAEVSFIDHSKNRD
ncbi:MAG: S41 family peptidase [Verrucomicrobiales bacterium]|nr:S41 family peptidase [Verrucomicrobiales bacterium]